MAIERLYGGVDIENPWLSEKRPHAIVEMLLQPRQPGVLLDLVEAAPYRVLADHLAHAQQRRIDRVAAQCRHMRIAPVAGQHRQQHCPQNVPFARCVRAAEIQRATRTLLQELNEEWKLAQRRYPRR